MTEITGGRHYSGQSWIRFGAAFIFLGWPICILNGGHSLLHLCSAKTSSAPNSCADSHMRPELFKYLQHGQGLPSRYSLAMRLGGVVPKKHCMFACLLLLDAGFLAGLSKLSFFTGSFSGTRWYKRHLPFYSDVIWNRAHHALGHADDAKFLCLGHLLQWKRLNGDWQGYICLISHIEEDGPFLLSRPVSPPMLVTDIIPLLECLHPLWRSSLPCSSGVFI